MDNLPEEVHDADSIDIGEVTEEQVEDVPVHIDGLSIVCEETTKRLPVEQYENNLSVAVDFDAGIKLPNITFDEVDENVGGEDKEGSADMLKLEDVCEETTKQRLVEESGSTLSDAMNCDAGIKLPNITFNEIDENVGGKDKEGSADMLKPEDACEDITKSSGSNVQDDGSKTNLLPEVTDKCKPVQEKNEMKNIKNEALDLKCLWSSLLDDDDDVHEDSSLDQEIESSENSHQDSDENNQSISENSDQELPLTKESAEIPPPEADEAKCETKDTKKSPQKAANKGKEKDPATLTRRLKEISYGKHTVGYRRYLAQVPKSQRQRGHPITPPMNRKFSRRCWDGLVKNWRLRLHEFDPPNLNSNLTLSVPPSGSNSCTTRGVATEKVEDIKNSDVNDDNSK